MPDLAVSNDTEIIAKVKKTAEILRIFKVHTYGEQTVGFNENQRTALDHIERLWIDTRPLDVLCR